ncbi:hypothetical protein FRX31_003766 [Thalictrum thalictroides]|uniref:Retrotransposon Copia-like N-terminal domain-containing protein n=1 Tax=Thalictrum thalictroides TaxID=46969 RepID=A0A7J6XDY8_THATH|nr:hypothetical protein FRX31_003766 [Thalictrum thalictroides]
MASNSGSSSDALPLLGPITHFLNVKLDRTNYLLWRSQFIPILHVHDLLDFVDGTNTCPPECVPSTDGETIVSNPAFSSWMKRDQLLLSWLIS